MIQQQAIKGFFLIFLVFTFSCNQEKSKNPDEVKKIDLEHNFNYEDITQLKNSLAENKFTLNYSESIDSSKLPFIITKDFHLFSLKGTTPIDYKLEKWSYDNDIIDVWIVEFQNNKDVNRMELRLDSLCETKSTEKVILRKNMRGFKFFDKKLVLLKHSFFTEKQKGIHKGIIDYMKRGFDCW